MDDKELFETWKQGDSREKETYRKHEGSFEDLAKQRSADVFRKIRTNIKWEAAASVIAALGGPFFFLNNPPFFAIIVVLMIIASVLTAQAYIKYLGSMKRLNEQSVLRSLEKKVAILSGFIRRLRFYMYLVTPFAFAAGLAFSFSQEAVTVGKIAWVAVISLPLLALFLWLINKYMYAVYGRHLNALQEIYRELSENNGGNV